MGSGHGWEGISPTIASMAAVKQLLLPSCCSHEVDFADFACWPAPTFQSSDNWPQTAKSSHWLQRPFNHHSPLITSGGYCAASSNAAAMAVLSVGKERGLHHPPSHLAILALSCNPHTSQPGPLSFNSSTLAATLRPLVYICVVKSEEREEWNPVEFFLHGPSPRVPLPHPTCMARPTHHAAACMSPFSSSMLL